MKWENILYAIHLWRGLEQEMMLPPNFTPRGSSSDVLCGYSPYGAGVDCQSCLDHRRQSNRTLICLHITERLQAGTVTIVELAAETVRPWKHLGLKQRAVGIAGRTWDFHFEDQLVLHRVKRMKDLKGRTDWERLMLERRRKTLAVCPECHEKIHSKTISADNKINGEPYTSRGVRTVREGVRR